MGTRNFRAMLEERWSEGKFVCIGLDTDYRRIPESVSRDAPVIMDRIVDFNRAIAEATADIACCYKPNSAFYENAGDNGLRALQTTIFHIKRIAPDVPVILDAKRADIGTTNAQYAGFAFDGMAADAITVHPYLGRETLDPLLSRKDKGIIVLCRTSNPGADEFQDLDVDGEPLYLRVARNVAESWNLNGNCALVVGATYPRELARVREAVGDMPILIPGIGAQGGDLEATVRAGIDSRGAGMMINSSRGIIFASNGPDFAEASRTATIDLHDAIGRIRKTVAVR